MNKSFTIIVTVILLVAAFLVGANIDREQEPLIEPVVLPTATPTPESFESEIMVLKSEFMSGCTEDGENIYDEFCECSWNYMNNNTTNSELVTEFMRYDETEEFSPLMTNALTECLYLME